VLAVCPAAVSDVQTPPLHNHTHLQYVLPLANIHRHEVYDGKTDVWSFGVLLSELLTGQIPYQHTFMTPVQVSWRRQATAGWGLPVVRGLVTLKLPRLVGVCNRAHSACQPPRCAPMLSSV
jgi:serine/threonine protein kinase